MYTFSGSNIKRYSRKLQTMRRFLCSIGGMLLLVCTLPSLLAQKRAATSQQTANPVPFIGCKSDGQVGPLDAPPGTSPSLPITSKAAQQLAYYQTAKEIGVLAPRGWYCFGAYGSGGESLFVSPQPIDFDGVIRSGFTEPIIEISHRFGFTSGRFGVAEVIARVFPAYKAFVQGVMSEGSDVYEFGPYRHDTLNYRSKRIVEYRTAARSEGLGTWFGLMQNESPIDGVAILIGQTPDLLFLAVRLPPNLTGLTSTIIHQVERDASKHSTM